MNIDAISDWFLSISPATYFFVAIAILVLWVLSIAHRIDKLSTRLDRFAPRLNAPRKKINPALFDVIMGDAEKARKPEPISDAERDYLAGVDPFEVPKDWDVVET